MRCDLPNRTGSRLQPDQGRRRPHADQPGRLPRLAASYWSYLNKVDLDTTWPGVHKTPGQDAQAARAAFERAHPAIAAKMDWRPTEHGGLHSYFLTNGPMLRGKIYDADGRHIGEMISGDTDTSILPANLQPGRLSSTERDHMLRTWRVDAPSGDGDRWTDRKREGLRYVAGYNRHRVTTAMLRAFLRTQCGIVGGHLDQLFDVRTPFDRSNATGNLAQCLMLNIHKDRADGWL